MTSFQPLNEKKLVVLENHLAICFIIGFIYFMLIF